MVLYIAEMWTFMILIQFFRNYCTVSSRVLYKIRTKFCLVESGPNFNFLLVVPMGVHSYFGRVVPPNNETTPMGVTGTLKRGSRGLSCYDPLRLQGK